MHFILPLPETTNSAYATRMGQWYKTTKQKAWEERSLWEIRKQQHKHTDEVWNPRGEIYIEIDWFLKRERDIDGGIKPVLDIFTRAGIYIDDRQVKHLSVIKMFDKDRPRCEIKLKSL